MIGDTAERGQLPPLFFDTFYKTVKKHDNITRNDRFYQNPAHL